MQILKVEKRDGTFVDFDLKKIIAAIEKAFQSQNTIQDPQIIELLALKVSADFKNKIEDGYIQVEQIQDSVESVLAQSGYVQEAKAFILYRVQRTNVRKLSSERIEGTSMDLESLKQKIVASYVGRFWSNDIFDASIREAMENKAFEFIDDNDLKLGKLSLSLGKHFATDSIETCIDWIASLSKEWSAIDLYDLESVIHLNDDLKNLLFVLENLDCCFSIVLEEKEWISKIEEISERIEWRWKTSREAICEIGQTTKMTPIYSIDQEKEIVCASLWLKDTNQIELAQRALITKKEVFEQLYRTSFYPKTKQLLKDTFDPVCQIFSEEIQNQPLQNKKIHVIYRKDFHESDLFLILHSLEQIQMPSILRFYTDLVDIDPDAIEVLLKKIGESVNQPLKFQLFLKKC
ncbi:ATP cone domain-containing protein [Dubosiella newyorkensis]|uniref:ATP cone domain-containing protein n=1 Tax=Dubosiella newyorkensis TaxID=1862672 RepID=UPI0025722CAD|nr:ATP cone domain-containing protein [Dubosiella newyorkensis]